MKAILLVLLLASQVEARPLTFQERKAVHVLAGFTIAYTGKKLGYPKTGLALGILAGVGKELYDNRFGESRSSMIRDVAITGGGAYVGFKVRW